MFDWPLTAMKSVLAKISLLHAVTFHFKYSETRSISEYFNCVHRLWNIL